MNTRVCTGSDISTLVEQIDRDGTGGLAPTLAIAFCSIARDFHHLRQELVRRGIAVVGATTAGEIAGNRILEESCAVMLMDADPAAFHVAFLPVGDGDSMRTAARRLGAEAVLRFDHPVILAFASGLQANGEDVIHGVREGAGRALPLFGGMAGDDLRLTGTYVFSQDGVSDQGIVALVLDGDRFHIEGLAANGWQPVGVEKTITRSEGNIVFTIDHRPAVSVYREYLNIEDTTAQPLDLAAIGVQYPIRLERANGTAVIRAAMFFRPEDGAMVFAGGVPEGAKIKFCIPPALDIVERVVGEAHQVRRAIPAADAVLLVNCKARHMALGPLAEDEVQELHALWNVPTIGYLSYGEIGGRRPEECDFHTETCTLVVLRDTATA